MSEASSPEAFEQAKRHFGEGLEHFENGRFEAAQQAYEASLALLPGRSSTLLNLAATHLRLGRHGQALQAADEVLAQEPDNIDAWFNRGRALAETGRHDAALEALEKVLAARPELAEPWFRQGQVLQNLGRPAQALRSFERALALDAGHADAWTQSGNLLRELARPVEAAQAFRQALEHGADPELTGFFLASVQAQGLAPACAPERYVASLFDQYADEFDQHLVERLHYQAHTALVEGLIGLGRSRFRCAIDLGCGTGLCGPLVRPLADRLVGVDLSGRMLDKARALGVYDELRQADIVAALQGAEAGIDLLLSADVFIYIGDLVPVFAAARRALVGGGVFCFTIEIAADGAAGFVLLPSLRYAHSETHVRSLAAAHGFEVLAVQRHPIRYEQREAIAGMSIYLGRR